ncbi:MAG TPA: hypothetical protein PKC18_19220 [Lacipirellulaceae bacterium]|nr:hypothetical protein [Lacipirellulaceae bacterium]HMP05077.1 hypothetical protein [Lacipirellulaceae bacterium]
MLALVPAAPPIRNGAPELLGRARLAFDQGAYIEAGALMREAIRQTLAALVEYHDLPMPRRKVRRTAGELAILLEKAGKLADMQANWALELLEIGNRAAHCAFVERRELSSAIGQVQWFLCELPAAVGGDA